MAGSLSISRHNAILPETEDNFCSIANKTKEKLWCQGGSNSHCCSLYFKELGIKRNTSNDLSRETEKFSQLATWYYEKRFEDTQLNYLLSTSSLKLNLPFLKNINGRQKPFVVLKRVFSENINDMKCQRIWTLFQQILSIALTFLIRSLYRSVCCLSFNKTVSLTSTHRTGFL